MANRLRLGVLAALSCASLLSLAPGVPSALAASPGECTTTLQSLVDAAPAGGSLIAPPCIYRESVKIDKPLTLEGQGAVIDGRDASGQLLRPTWMIIDSDDVTIRGFTMRYANNPPQSGALRVLEGRSRITLAGLDLSYAGGADVAIGEGNAVVLRDSDIHHGGTLGVHAGGGCSGTCGQRNEVVGNRIHDNNYADAASPEFEAGGLKATVQTGLLMADNQVYDNHGPGLWCDIYCKDVTVRGNRIHGNTHAGVFFEVSTGASITGNRIWDNGWGKNVWGWGAGVLISSAGGAEVSGNTVAWNAAGISVISQNRQDWRHSATDNYIHDNTIVSEPDHYLLMWAQDWEGELFTAGSHNRGASDRYWVSPPENGQRRFAWDGDVTTLAEFNATPGESAGTYLTTGQKDEILAAAEIPTRGAAATRPPPAQPGIGRLAPLLPYGLAAAVLIGLGTVALVLVWRRRGARTGSRGGPRG